MAFSTFISVFLPFLLGSIPTGYIISKLNGIDIRQAGSGNIGASNAFRVLGKKEGALTLFFDMLKGFVSVLIVWIMYKDLTLSEIAAFFAVLGHDFSIFLKFKGGKGVATSYGVALFFTLYSLIGVFLWLIILKFTKYASLASLLSFFILTLIIVFTHKDLMWLFFVLFILMIIKHYQNINRLIHGSEHKIK